MAPYQLPILKTKLDFSDSKVTLHGIYLTSEDIISALSGARHELAPSII
jgi:hypothetical protein